MTDSSSDRAFNVGKEWGRVLQLWGKVIERRDLFLQCFHLWIEKVSISSRTA